MNKCCNCQKEYKSDWNYCAYCGVYIVTAEKGVKLSDYVNNVYTSWDSKEELYENSLGVIINRGGFVTFENPTIGTHIQFSDLPDEKELPLVCNIPSLIEESPQPKKKEIKMLFYGFYDYADVCIMREMDLDTAVKITHKFFTEACNLEENYEVKLGDYDLDS